MCLEFGIAYDAAAASACQAIGVEHARSGAAVHMRRHHGPSCVYHMWKRGLNFEVGWDAWTRSESCVAVTVSRLVDARTHNLPPESTPSTPTPLRIAERY